MGAGKQSLLMVVGRAAELQDGKQQELLAQSCSLQEKVCGVSSQSLGERLLLSSVSLQVRVLITAGVAKGFLPHEVDTPGPLRGHPPFFLSFIPPTLLASPPSPPSPPGSHVINAGLGRRQWSSFCCQSAVPGSGQIFLPQDQHSTGPMAGFEPSSMTTKGLC